MRSYDYTIYRSCGECPPEAGRAVTISVSDGVVTARVYAATGQPASASATDFTTIDALFDIVDKAIAQDAYRVDASYDPAIGVPLHIFVDPWLQGIDDEYGLTVSNFRAR